MTVSERLNQLKADYLDSYQKAHGSLDGAMRSWADLEPRMTIAARAEVERAQAEEAEAAKAREIAALRRSEMSTKAKVAFIQQYGGDAYRLLNY